MGYRCFALLLRFISFCQRHNLDPREYGYIYQMIEVGDYSELAGKPAPPPYRFVLLELREWTRRLARFPETRHTTINNEPPWFFDYEQGEYISYFLPLDEELASETDLRVEKAQQETWQDYKERRDADTKQRGLESYSGKRSDTHDYWIYLYKVKGLSSDEIHKREYPDHNPNKDPDLSSIERAMSRRLKLAHIEFYPFGKKRKLEKKLAKYRPET